MSYYIREGQGQWQACNAQTIGAAKRAAVRAQAFQGTDCWVGRQAGDTIEPIAVKRADALDMSRSGAWTDINPEHAHIGDFGRA